MALVNLQTNLKSLAYGKDRPGGESSNQPYVSKEFSKPKNLAFSIASIGGGSVNLPTADINIGNIVINQDTITVGGETLINSTKVQSAGIIATTLAGAVVGGIIGAPFGAVGVGALIGGAAGATAAGLGTNIPGINEQVGGNFILPEIGGGNISVSNTTDFLFRGGLSAPLYGIEDTTRIGAYFLDLKTPNGLFFSLKQNLLSRVAVRTETSGFLNDNFYLPTNTLAQTAISALGMHIPKQGILPLPGFRTTFGKDTYEGIVEKRKDRVGGDTSEEEDDKNDPVSVKRLTRNRLVALYRVKILQEIDRKKINGIIIDEDQDQTILKYRGGPGSILGIGRTRIRFSDTVPLINNEGKDLSGSNNQTDREDIEYADRVDVTTSQNDENAKRIKKRIEKAKRKEEREARRNLRRSNREANRNEREANRNEREAKRAADKAARQEKRKLRKANRQTPTPSYETPEVPIEEYNEETTDEVDFDGTEVRDALLQEQLRNTPVPTTIVPPS